MEENKPSSPSNTPSASSHPEKEENKDEIKSDRVIGGSAEENPEAPSAAPSSPSISEPVRPAVPQKPEASSVPPKPPVPEIPKAPAIPQKPGAPSVPAKPGGLNLPPKKPKSSLSEGKGEKPEKKKLVKVGIIVGVAFLILLFGYKIFKKTTGSEDGGSQQGNTKSEMAVNVMEVKLDRFQDILVAVGTVAGGSEIPLRFEVEGTIVFFEFREGDKVRKGNIIARLNQRDTYLKLKKAELELDQYEKLYAIGGIARNRLEEARVAADLSRSEMDKTVLRAPRDGIIGDKDAEVGEFITPNKKIAILVNIESVIVRVGIIEKEVDKVFPGQKIMLTVDTYPGVEFTGRVENISPIFQGSSKTLTIEARLDNEGGLLLPGMFARTRIVIFEEDEAIAVPNDAVDKTQTGHRVFVVTKENKAEARDIEVGYVSSQFSQVTYGLTPGELVVTQKPQELKSGSPVKVIEVQK